MKKASPDQVNQKVKAELKESDKPERRTSSVRPFDELYKGESYVVKEQTDYYRLKHIPKAAPKEPPQHFHPGDRVKNNYGRLLTVLVQLGNLVIVKEEFSNYHSKDLTLIEHTADTYQA